MAVQGQDMTDPYAYWPTAILVSIAYRVTPAHERPQWVATSGQDTSRMTDDDLRFYVTEQLQDYGITHRAICDMKS